MNDLQFMPHQEEVLNLTDDKNRCAYYLDMGLGKTFVGAEKMYLLNNTVNLIVCQKSKVDDWVDHMKTYYPEYRVMDLTKKSEGVNFRTLVETKDLYDQNIQIVGVINTILIDIDDAEQSEILMNIVEEYQLDCRVYCTSRGRHFLFKNHSITRNRTHVPLAVGLTADIKLGTRSSYEVIKIDGEERFIEWDIEEGGTYQEVPKWLFPVRTAVDFLDMDAGDGRNQALFNYILTLTSN